MSKKRILPALILAGSVGFIGLHRLYAGRYFTGLLQMALFAAGFAILLREFHFSQILQALDSLESLADPNQFQDIASNNLDPIPILLVSVPILWALYDCLLLSARRFRDSEGNPITIWI